MYHPPIPSRSFHFQGIKMINNDTKRERAQRLRHVLEQRPLGRICQGIPRRAQQLSEGLKGQTLLLRQRRWQAQQQTLHLLTPRWCSKARKTGDIMGGMILMKFTGIEGEYHRHSPTILGPYQGFFVLLLTIPYNMIMGHGMNIHIWGITLHQTWQLEIHWKIGENLRENTTKRSSFGCHV